MNKPSYQNVVCICGEKVNPPNRLTMHDNCRHIWIKTFNFDVTKATAYLKESTRKRKEHEEFLASLPEDVDNGVKQPRTHGGSTPGTSSGSQAETATDPAEQHIVETACRESPEEYGADAMMVRSEFTKLGMQRIIPDVD